MSKQYVIKNCNVLYYNPDNTAICNDLMIEYPCRCKERTNCLLKQIVYICKDAMDVEKNLSPKSGVYFFAQRILCFLDIEDVE